MNLGGEPMHRFIFVFLLMCTLTTAGHAQFVIDPITYADTDCTNPALAASPDGLTMLAYISDGDPLLQDFVTVQPMLTLKDDTYLPFDPLVLGPGGAPEICWAWDGFHVAFVAASVIIIFHADVDGNWNTSTPTMLAPDGPVRSLELLGADWDSGNPHVFLVVHTTDGGGGEANRVQFSSCDQSGWSALESLDLEPQMGNPQLTFYMGSYTQVPHLFYHGGENPSEMHLKSSFLAPSTGWSDPQLIYDLAGMPSPIANEFDVTAGFGTGDISILGLGMQPTCPCGTIHLHSYVSVIQSWQVHNVTAHYADYDWPMSPKVDSAYESFISHAFWYQEAVADDFTPWNRTLEYRTIENGGMTDMGDFLDEPGHGGNFGSRVALTVDYYDNPVLAWTRTDTIEGEPQPERIWVARHFLPTAVPESELPASPLKLTAWPNPFNPQISIAFELDQTQAIKLQVFDARGRRVATLLDGIADAGHSELSWNATDDSGRKLSSGIYFARLISDHEKSVLKLVLAE